jgi:hypothetical protein
MERAEAAEAEADVSEMVERIVAALEKLPIRDNLERGGELDKLRLREAVRALIAVMREPTQEMLNAGMEAHAHYTDNREAAHLWQAMINAALK